MVEIIDDPIRDTEITEKEMNDIYDWYVKVLKEAENNANIIIGTIVKAGDDKNDK